ncbi:hypothetical protein TNCV_4195961, partial [Trichonephila clavipes]
LPAEMIHQIKLNKTFSNTFELSQDVLQGSVLSRTHSSVYLDGIEKVTSSGIRIAMFADDIVLWSSATAIPDFE